MSIVENEILLEERIFIADYVNYTVNKLIVYPKFRTIPRNKLIKFVLRTIKERGIKSKVKVHFNKEETDLLDLLDYIVETKPIISGFGTLFRNQEEQFNLLSRICEEFQLRRDRSKKKKFEHINDEDQTLANKYDLEQLNYKVLNNSVFGALGQHNFIFFNPLLGPSITACGEDIITTSVITFEQFLTGNFRFDSENDAISYICNILGEEYEDVNVQFNRELTHQEVYEHLVNHITKGVMFKTDILTNTVSLLDQDELRKVYYKNNLYEFINDSNILDHFDLIIDREDFLDPNEPPKDIIPVLESIWGMFKVWVMYDYADYYRAENGKDRTRRAVLTIKMVA